MTRVVLDASITIAWALEETDARAALARQTVENGQAVVPRLWWFEVRNGLIVNERRGRINQVLSDEDQLDPEQSTSAIVVHHPQAKYFSV